MTYITESMIFSSLKYQMNLSQSTYYADVQRASSNLQISNAEDNPAGAANVSILKDSLKQMEGMKRVSTMVEARINDSANAMLKMEEILNQAQQNAIRAGDGALNPEDRIRIAAEMTQAQEQFLQQANATSNGRYIFGGFADDSAPYALDGTYSGDDSVNRLEVAPSLYVDANVPGTQVVNVTGGQNVLSVLGNLITALNNNDRQGIQDGLDNIKQSHDQVSLAVANIGGPQSSIEYARKLRLDLGQSLEEQRVGLEETDAPQAYTDMIQSATAMQAAMSVTQQVLQSINRSIGR